MTTQELLQESANMLLSYEYALDNVMYSSYQPEDLQKRVDKLRSLQRGLEELIETLGLVKDVMES